MADDSIAKSVLHPQLINNVRMRLLEEMRHEIKPHVQSVEYVLVAMRLTTGGFGSDADGIS